MAEAALMRERLFTMRLSDEESSRLDEVSKHYGLNAAGLIRMLVKREFDLLPPKSSNDPEPRATKKKAKR